MRAKKPTGWKQSAGFLKRVRLPRLQAKYWKTFKQMYQFLNLEDTILILGRDRRRW